MIFTPTIKYDEKNDTYSFTGYYGSEFKSHLNREVLSDNNLLTE